MTVDHTALAMLPLAEQNNVMTMWMIQGNGSVVLANLAYAVGSVCRDLVGLILF